MGRGRAKWVTELQSESRVGRVDHGRAEWITDKQNGSQIVTSKIASVLVILRPLILLYNRKA